MRNTTIGIVMFIVLVGIGAVSHAQTKPAPAPAPSLVEQAQTLINNDKTAVQAPGETGGDSLSDVLDKLDQVIARGQKVTPTKPSEPAGVRSSNAASPAADVPVLSPTRVVADDNTELKALISELRDLVGQLREIVSRKD